MMRGEKPTPKSVTVLPDWAWAKPNFGFSLNIDKSKIKSITIDPKGRMADVDSTNNIMGFAITKEDSNTKND